MLKARDAALLANIDARFQTLDTELTKDQVKALSVAVDAVSADIARVAGVVAQ